MYYCSICLEESDMQMYTLPECNHTFHTNCILAWFRKGSKTCPLCKHSGNQCIGPTLNRLASLLTIAQSKHSPPCLQKISKEYIANMIKTVEYKKKYNDEVKDFNNKAKRMRKRMRNMDRRNELLKEQILAHTIERVIIPVKHIYFDEN